MAYEELKAKLKQLYLPSDKEFSEIEVPKSAFAVLDGSGDPAQNGFQDGVKSLFAAIHPIRLDVKKRMGKDFVEAPLEALYWADNMEDFTNGRKDKMKWRLMVPMPHWVDETSFADALAQTEAKLKQKLPEGLRLDWLEEGLVVQIMHIGSPEGQTEKLKELYQNYLPENGLEPSGFYHEIYLNDHKRTAPQKRKTVLRQPVTWVG